MSTFKANFFELDFDYLRDAYYEACALSTKPNFNKPNIGDIIDENKTVVWNKNEVARLREMYDSERESKIKNKYSQIEQCKQNTINYIASLHDNTTREQATKIFDFAYERMHDCISDMFGLIEDLVDLFVDLNNC